MIMLEKEGRVLISQNDIDDKNLLFKIHYETEGKNSVK